jgi:heptosyltransferase-1
MPALKILIVRVSSLGDVVHNLPMVSDLRRRFPDASIDWVVEEAYVELVRLHPDVRHVIPFALRRWRKSLWSSVTRAQITACLRQLRSESYDYVFDTQGLFKTGALMRIARLAPGGRRAGLANATEGSGYESLSRIFHDISVPVGLHTHGVTRSREVAAAVLGYALPQQVEFKLGTPVPEPVPACLPDVPFALLFHATARAAKRWPEQRWIELARHLAGRGLRVLLPWGSAAEREAARRLAAHMPNAEVLPSVSVLQAMALIRRAALVVGVDTGLTHIAAALGSPTIELYCDSPRWKTEGFWSPRIVNLGDTGAPPELEAVVAAVAALLDHPQGERRAALAAVPSPTLFEKSP